MSDPGINRRRLVAGGIAATGIVALGSSALGAVHAAKGHGAPASRAGATPSASATTPKASTASTSGVRAGSTPSSAAARPTPTARTAAELTTRLRTYQGTRGGTFSVALYDRRNRSTFTFEGDWRNETLSTVKVLIMTTVLRQCQESSRTLTDEQTSLARAMITESDNDAANALLTWAGLANVQRVARLCGLKSTVIQGGTTAGTSSWWGYSTSTAADLIKLLNGVVWGMPVLTTANRNYLKSLMSQVIPAQRWGVCAPPLPTSNTWNTKNGWGDHTGGYRLNSLGHITGNGRDFSAVILSRAPRGFYYGRDTVNGIATILYDAMASPLR